MNNYWAFAPMRPSDDVRDDPEALRSRLAADGYLWMPGMLAPGDVDVVRRDVDGVLADHGWVTDGVATGRPVREGDDDYFGVYDDVQRLESFHTLAHHPRLVALMADVLDGPVFPHPLKVARLVFPGHDEASTPPHQDYPNNQGTTSLTAAWIPLGDCPRELGSLAVLRGSHRAGVLPLRFALGPGNRQADVHDDVLAECTWVTTDFAAGDVVLFPSLTVHAALNNATFAMRLSVDFRYQRDGDELTDMVLEPHFGRQSWDEIYAGWTSADWQYYWRDHDYVVVPFDRTHFEATPPTDEEVQQVMAYELRRTMRHEATSARRDQG